MHNKVNSPMKALIKTLVVSLFFVSVFFYQGVVIACDHLAQESDAKTCFYCTYHNNNVLLTSDHLLFFSDRYKPPVHHLDSSLAIPFTLLIFSSARAPPFFAC